jgi:hypothetical protein
MTTEASEAPETPETPAPYDVAIERTKKALARNPQISAADFFVRFLEPLLGELRAEYSEQLEDINDTLDTLDVPDENITEQAKQLVLMLGNLIDNTFARVGWTGPQGPTEDMPADIEQAFRLAAGETRSFFERLASIEEDDEDEDDEDEAEAEADADADEGAATEATA